MSVPTFAMSGDSTIIPSLPNDVNPPWGIDIAVATATSSCETPVELERYNDTPLVSFDPAKWLFWASQSLLAILGFRPALRPNRPRRGLNHPQRREAPVAVGSADQVDRRTGCAAEWSATSSATSAGRSSGIQWETPSRTSKRYEPDTWSPVSSAARRPSAASPELQT